jgi:glutamate formiminotransferase
MRLLAVPNWSFGRNKHLLRLFQDALDDADVFVHYCQGDVDHNRTVTAFSGEPQAIETALHALCALAFDVIDLNRHVGVHPRIGALDVCPIVPLSKNQTDFYQANALAERVAAGIAGRYGIPVFLYERSERGRHEADLPSLRRGGFGGLEGRILNPDFGPEFSHPLLGVTVVGVRDFLVAMNVDLGTEDIEVAKHLAKHVRELRREGDSRFLGVRALGFPLASRELVQLSMNITLPDLTPIDPIIEWVYDQASDARIRVASTELVGVIRDVDVAAATRLPIREQQIIATQQRR